ncbi:MAG: hypothetical protein RLZZ450_4844 [Pseudomonadota bacterium]|jgi:cellulose synthase (UDP-forming)
MTEPARTSEPLEQTNDRSSAKSVPGSILTTGLADNTQLGREADVTWYFEEFEQRVPAPPVPASAARDFVYQALAVAALALGSHYMWWRWTASLNLSVWWFSVPLVAAETLAFGGSVLFFLSIWRGGDTPRSPLPATRNDIADDVLEGDRPLIVDVFFPTFNEDVELVRRSIRDAKAMRYPYPIDVRIHVLDDGKREQMRAVAEAEGVGYITRATNIGYKAGNMRNGMEQTQGDLLVICDADTRPFPNLLEETLGYFRDSRVAWVQTPQWFFDTVSGRPLTEVLGGWLGGAGRGLGRLIEGVFGVISCGADPFGNDPRLFYDVIQRRRNWCNAAFCCGAGSVHRREAVMESALKAYAEQVSSAVAPFTTQVHDPVMREELFTAMSAEAAREIEFTPYKFHVSEDIYTSIVLHSDEHRKWRSVYHPVVVTKMLSPQDLLTWSIQRFKYAGGTLDIFRNDNPLRRPGLSAWQKLCYGSTIYSYFAPLWTVMFLLAPMIYFFSGWSPVTAYDSDFYAHFVPFIIVNRLAFMVGTWGVDSRRGEQYYLAFFWLNIKALRDVALGRPVKFHVTPKTRQSGNYYVLVWPHIAIVVLSALGAAWMGYQVYLGEGNVSAYIVNVFWVLNNALSLWVMVSAASATVKA